MSVSATSGLASFAEDMRTRDLPKEILTKASVCLLDALGLAMRSEGEGTTAAITSLFTNGAPSTGCTLWQSGQSMSVMDAVLCNGVAVHSHFQDDCDMTSWSHPGSLIAPAAVCLTEFSGGSLATALRAIIGGYAALNWLGADEVVGRAVVARGFRASPTLGPVAAAVAASVALGLSHDEVVSAIGIAADMSGGTLEPVRTGAANWRVQNGSAAWRGALSALLAQRKVQGSLTALEGDGGFVRAFAGMAAPTRWSTEPDIASVLTVWEKAFPTLGDNIAVSLAAQQIARQLKDTSSITRIVVHQNAEFASYPGTSFRGPFERPAQAMASTAFAVATTLLRGEISLDAYDKPIAGAQIMRLIDRLTVAPEADYAYTDGMVEVMLGDASISAASWDVPGTLLFRDRVEARKVFVNSGGTDRERSRLESFADAVFDDQEAAESLHLGDLLRQLPRPGTI